MLLFSMVLLLHFKETGVENRTADQRLPCISCFTRPCGCSCCDTAHWWCSVLPCFGLTFFPLWWGDHDICHYRAHGYLEKPCVLPWERMPKENKASPLIAQQQFTFEGKKKRLTQSMALILVQWAPAVKGEWTSVCMSQDCYVFSGKILLLNIL